MRSRMNRYHLEETGSKISTTRSGKNQQLYRDLGKNTKYTNFTDVSKVNAIELDATTKSYRTREGYHKIKDYSDILEKPKVKRELDDFNHLYQDHENRVYDINSVLKEAKENRQERDELEKKRKLKNTNYNILASLDPEELERYRMEKQKSNKPDPEELRDLIDSITSRTLRGELDKATSVDLLSDLVATSVTDKITPEDLELSKQIVDKESSAQEKKESKSELDDMDKSFYTRSMDLSDKDFNFFDEDEDKRKPSIIDILLVIVAVAIVILVIYFVMKIVL